MVKSLLSFIPSHQEGDENHIDITEAYYSFFKVIIYWLKFGLNQQKRGSL